MHRPTEYFIYTTVFSLMVPRKSRQCPEEFHDHPLIIGKDLITEVDLHSPDLRFSRLSNRVGLYLTTANKRVPIGNCPIENATSCH